MRAMKRYRSLEERNRMVDDPAYRRAQLERFQAQARSREVLEFFEAYQRTEENAHVDPVFLSSAAGAFVRIPVDIRMQSAQAQILESFGNLFTDDGIGGLTPIETPFQWPPDGPIYAYFPPHYRNFPEEFDVIDRPRVRGV